MCRVYRVWLVVEVDDQLMEKGLYLSNLFYLTYDNPSLHTLSEGYLEIIDP